MEDLQALRESKNESYKHIASLLRRVVALEQGTKQNDNGVAEQVNEDRGNRFTPHEEETEQATQDGGDLSDAYSTIKIKLFPSGTPIPFRSAVDSRSRNKRRRVTICQAGGRAKTDG